MATLLEKRQQFCCRLGYLLVIEGCPYAFTDIADVAGTTYINDGREILTGLELPSEIRMGINPREGLLQEFSAAFRLTETKDNKLASLFRGVFPDATSYTLTERVTPADDPLGTSLNTTTGTVNPRGKHIGTEYIDSSGNRRSWYIHPVGGATPFDHPWVDGETGVPLATVEVSDEPRVWAGRHVALYELVYDDEAGDWATWSEQYTNCALIWRGTMQGRGLIVDTLQYEIVCDGPASLTRRLLNRTRPAERIPIQPRVSATAAQRGIAIVPHQRNAYNIDALNDTNFRASVFDDANDITSTDRTSFIDELSALLDDVADGSTYNYDGTGGTANTNYEDGADGGNSLSIDGQGKLGIQYHASSDSIGARCWICMHEKFWALLGYDPVAQNALDPESSYWIEFKPFDPATIELGFYWEAERYDGDPSASVLDFSGYWIGKIQTSKPSNQGEGPADNNGLTRFYQPLFSSGVVAIDPGGQQEIGLGSDFVYMDGQKCFAPGGTYGDAEDRPSVDGNQVNAMGWFILEGQIARGGSQFDEVELEDIVQVARCCWYDSGDGLITPAGAPAVVIETLEDPRAFGFEYDKITAPWLSGGETQVTATPMAVWASRGPLEPQTYPDKAWKTITKILLSSGTSGAWGTTGTPAFPSIGDNAPSVVDFSDYLAGDIEIADMGLGIEDPAVDLISFRRLHESTLQEADEGLGFVKVAAVGPIQSEDLLGGLLQGRGWSMGYIRQPGYVQPKFSGVDLYSQFDPGELPTVAGSLIHITESDIAGSVESVSSWIPRVRQTWRSPIDAFEVSSRSLLLDRGYGYESTIPALDKGAMRRSGSAVLDVRDGGLSNPGLFDSGESEWQWRSGFRNRFGRTIADFMAKPNREVTLTVSNPKGQWLYPGQPFLLTNPAINSLDGQSIGTNKAQCVVIEHAKILQGDYKGHHRITALMIGASLSGGFAKLWAGSAEVDAAVDNGSNSWTLTCKQDWLDAGHDGNDVLAFQEPDWSSVGGDTYVLIHQSRDHKTFDSGDQVIAQVTSITETPPRVTCTVSSGTMLRDTYKLITLAPYADQDAGGWVRDLIMFHTDGIGSTHTSGVDGSKLA